MATNFKSTRLKILSNTNIATLNVQGKLADPFQREVLLQDCRRYKVDIGCFQEVRCEESLLQTQHGKLITMPYDEGTEAQFKYGLGFYVAPKLEPYFYGINHVSNRIALIHFRFFTSKGRRLQLTIINVYAPTSQRVTNNPQEAEDFYNNLQDIYNKYSAKSHYVIIAGDLNSKLGTKLDAEEDFMGSHGKGTRNRNGHLLAEFLQNNRLYATNTTFDGPLRHRTTWSMYINGKMRYNQIDYIIIQLDRLRNGHQGLLKKSRSYNGLDFESDHRMVITKLNFASIYHLSKRQKTPADLILNYDRTALSTDTKVQDKFEETLNSKLDLLTEEHKKTPQEYFKKVAEILKEAAKDGLPEAPPSLRSTTSKKYLEDRILKDLTTRRRKIRTRLRGRPNPRNRRKLQKWKTELSRQIRERVRYLQETKAETVAKHLEQYKGSRRCFEAVSIMKKYTQKPLQIQTHEKTRIYNPKLQFPMIKEFYETFFNQADRNEVITPWEGETRPLEQPITAGEVAEAARKLNTGRAYGKDGTPGELYRYGGPKLYQHLATIFNKMFEEQGEVEEIGIGILITLNKLNGKPPVINNTRPITLLNMIRKILSNIVLARIQDIIFIYVSASQSAFKPKRSTSDVVWTYRWIMAMTQKYQQELFIMGIDLSKAFDCIDRKLLMDTLEELLQDKPSEFRIIKYLMSNTTLTARLQGKYGETFKTTLGIPQGDGLSPALFIIYLQAAVNYHRNKQRMSDPNYGKNTQITHYADDTDFISAEYGALSSAQVYYSQKI